MAIHLSFPKDEKKYLWLSNLLDTYYVSDQLVEDYLNAIAKKGTSSACHKGCHACCLNPVVPLTEPELIGISWYASEILSGDIRKIVKLRLYSHESTAECPFLVDKSCSIHPMRPLICRQFYVSSRACEPREDILSARPNDIVPIPQSVIQPIAIKLLNYYGFKTQLKKIQAFKSGFIPENARPMHLYDWSNIAKTMERFDNVAR